MPLLRRVRSLARNLFRRERVERDLDRELDGFLQELTDERIAAGMAPERARREARLALGGVEQVKEEVRAARTGSFLDTLAQDLRFGARMLRRGPAFTVVAVLTLALGIGAVTSIFSVVHAILLRPLPYPEPDRLVLLRQAYPQRGLTYWRLSPANFLTYRDQSKSFEVSGAWTWAGYNVSGGGEPARVQAAGVSADLFRTLGVRAALGRTFLPGEDGPGRRLLAILSDAEWKRRFGGDPGAVGRTLLLDNVPAEIVGVMPEGFEFIDPEVQIWTPLDLDPTRTSPFHLLLVGRLRPGVTLETAQQETTGILTSTSAVQPGFAGGKTAPPAGADLHTVVRPLADALTARARTPLLVLFGATALLLLIACSNVANLVLARSTARTREIAVRFALGATTARVSRQLLTEILLLGALGGAAGLGLALPILQAARSLPAGFLPRLQEVRLDPTVLAVALVSGLATALLAGLLPALRLARGGPHPDRPLQARGTTAPASRRASGALVGLQFALSLLLLVGSGLLLRSLHRLTAVDPGFDPSRLMTLSLDLPPRQAGVYANPLGAVAESEQEGTTHFYGRVVEAVRAQPGVGDAAIASSLPFGGDLDADMTVCEGREGPAGEEGSLTSIVRTTPGLFRTLGLPLLRGRDFTESDRFGGAPVAIVDETLAQAAWPGQDAVGRRIRYGWDDRPERWKTIVGVVAAIRDDRLDHGAEPHMYLPFGQEPMRRMSLVARSSGDPESIAAGIRAALAGVDPTVPAFAVRSMDETMGLSLFERRFTNLLLGAFAAVALLLAAAGIYGVMSLEVASRFKEIAVRMALGARPGTVFGLVLRHGGTLAALGMAAGLVASLAMMQLLTGLLFEIQPADPPTLCAVVLILGGVAFLACAGPARRATRVDPIAALRQD